MKDVICFYSHNNGEYRHFSNFYHSPFKENGKTYATNEHYYQACKATCEKDHEYIRKAKDPYEAKARGNKAKLRGDWDSAKFDVMKQGLRLKFSQNPELKAILLGTGEAVIHEETKNDKIWGWYKGTGKDLLGKALMAIRKELSYEK